jgi:hypothetical protein
MKLSISMTLSSERRARHPTRARSAMGAKRHRSRRPLSSILDSISSSTAFSHSQITTNFRLRRISFASVSKKMAASSALSLPLNSTITRAAKIGGGLVIGGSLVVRARLSAGSSSSFKAALSASLMASSRSFSVSRVPCRSFVLWPQPSARFTSSGHALHSSPVQNGHVGPGHVNVTFLACLRRSKFSTFQACL